MLDPIDDVLSGLARVANPLPFDPAICYRQFTIVANDFEHDIIVPALFRRLARQAPQVRLRTQISYLGEFDPMLISQVDVELTPRIQSEGSALIAACPSRLAQGTLQGLQSCPLPLSVDTLTFLMVWHVKHRESAEHRWFRQLIRSVADDACSCAASIT